MECLLFVACLDAVLRRSDKRWRWFNTARFRRCSYSSPTHTIESCAGRTANVINISYYRCFFHAVGCGCSTDGDVWSQWRGDCRTNTLTNCCCACEPTWITAITSLSSAHRTCAHFRRYCHVRLATLMTT